MCSTGLVVGLLAGTIGSASAADTASTTSTTSNASGTAPGGDAILPRARSAWDRGDWRQVATLYKQALDAGGLSPNASLDAYIRLGSASALLKRRDAALVAFRHAALLQPRFKVPHVAGRKGSTLAALARKQEAKIGIFHLAAEVPANVAASTPLQITATLDADHAAILSKIAVLASDAAATQTFREAQPSNTQVHFTLPANLVKSGATLTVRVDALDVHDNRMASIERLVHVAGDPAAIAGVAVLPVGPLAPQQAPADSLHGKASAGVQAPEVLLGDVKPLRAKTDAGATHEPPEHHGFWSTAWPYVIGGAAIAAGGAVAYFATRPGDDVTVGAARIDAR